MYLRTGDLVKVEITGSSEEWVSDATDRVTAALTPDLLRLEGKEAVPGTFNSIAEVIEFLVVGTASGLSAEALHAMIAAAWRKRKGTRPSANDDKPEVKAADVPEITVTTTADGVVEIRVRPRS